MIDFRYHIVSIVSVFLALALGLVLGTVAIDPVVVKDLNGRLTQVVNDKRTLESQVQVLRGQVSDGEEFAKAATEPLVRDQLTGRMVVVISLAGTPSGMRDQLGALLTTAGAHIAARVTLTDKYTDPQGDAVLDAVVGAVTPAGVVLNGATASQRSAQLLATVLTGRTGLLPLPALTPTASSPAATPTTTSGRGGSSHPATSLPLRTTGTTAPSSTLSTVPSTSSTVSSTPSTVPGATTTTAVAPEPDVGLERVLQAYRAAGLLSIDASSPTAADLVVVLTPEGPVEGKLPASVDADRIVDLVGALAASRSASVIVAGPTTAIAGGILSIVRAAGVSNLVSTVDGADTPYGLVATIRALRAELFGVVARYGVAANDRALPESVPGR